MTSPNHMENIDHKDSAASAPGDALSISNANDSFAEYMAKDAAHQARCAALRPANKAVLLNALAAANIARVTVSFDGYGDSGQIESVDAVDIAAAACNLPGIDVTLHEAVWDQEEPRQQASPLPNAIERLAYHLLGSLHGGWEINEGSYGVVVFDVAAAIITLDMNTRFTASEQHLTTL
jgi:hypothetical protein